MVSDKKEQSKQVYIFRNTLFPIIKIGISDNPTKRRTTVENASGFPLELVYESAAITKPITIERLIHKRLEEYRQRGEWFTIDITQAIEIVKQILLDADLGEYKDLLKNHHLTRDCTELLEYAITDSEHISVGGDATKTYSEEEDFMYRDKFYNYYIIYFQGELKRTVRFCNLHLAKKFKKENRERLLKIE